MDIGYSSKLCIKLCGTNYPVSISFIVVNEFCERFSYYGMKAVLTLYFINYLHWDPNLSTAVYHAFSSLCYFTPVLGALIADSWLGKFKTIVYLSVVYVLGHIVKSVGAIPSVGDSTIHIVLSMVGLILIAFGTGGIKPCVAAFGGDQFDEEHTNERRKFFSIFYMSINGGSVLSTLITPILRGDVQCFGGDCYALAFGVPAILMVVALVVFISGSGMYKKSPPEGNILLDVCKCMGLAIKNRWKSSKYDPKKKHWLDWAEDKYPRRLIHEIKMVLRVLVLYIPLPMFWALFDQQGSRWTLQATRMNMAFVSVCPVFCSCLFFQMLNALLILVFVPIFDMVVYPLIGLCRINLTPLKKMAVGMIFAALAFGSATLVEVNVTKTVVETAPQGQCLLQVYNLAVSDVKLNIPGSNLFSQPIKSYEKCIGAEAFNMYTVSNRFINTRSEAVNITVGAVDFYVPADYGISPHNSVERKDIFSACTEIILQKMEDVKANNVHIAWQIPQYVLITAGEVMFSITGLEFSYSQAPANMKSVLQAGWLLTVAFGNVIVLIVAEGAGLDQWMEFLLFAGLLVAVCIIFSIMAYFYTYVDPDELDKLFPDKAANDDDEDNLKKNQKYHMDQTDNSMYLNPVEKSTKM
uniref:Solute carrier family 15 member 2 n=1 Tax=Salmo trutta TaxID=8032 RepID=A0A674D9N3_SALTR